MSGSLPQGVVVLIRREGRYLFIQRGPNESLPNRWSHLSGAVEPGETQAQTAVREAMEEVALPIRPLRKLSESMSVGGRFVLHWWLAEALDGEPRVNCDEVADLRWCTLAEARALPGHMEDAVAVLAALLEEGG